MPFISFRFHLTTDNLVIPLSFSRYRTISDFVHVHVVRTTKKNERPHLKGEIARYAVKCRKMEYDSELSLLSSKFTQEDYPPATYPELIHKHGRPCTCLLIEAHDDYFICIPFRSSIRHKNAFLFTQTARSKKSKSGLDYTKISIIKNNDYFDPFTVAIVDQDEYSEMMRNLPTIVQEATDYMDTYINYVNGTAPMHPRAFARKYQYSTLPYFHSIMEI